MHDIAAQGWVMVLDTAFDAMTSHAFRGTLPDPAVTDD
jgi:hypothetical protein